MDFKGGDWIYWKSSGGAYIDAVVTTDRARSGVGWLGRAEHLPSLCDDVPSLPNHAAHRARVHVLDQTREKRSLRQISVVLLQHLLSGHCKLQSHELITLLFKTLQHLTYPIRFSPQSTPPPTKREEKNFSKPQKIPSTFPLPPPPPLTLLFTPYQSVHAERHPASP